MPLNSLICRAKTIYREALSFFVVFQCLTVVGQIPTDTLSEIQLEEVTVKAFEQNRKLREIPASVFYIGKQALNRFSPTSIVHAMNTAPGVRMEERSPGSYRFNIRGSALRSPFGVRNIKVYFNDLPFTDPGGHTYLNQLGYYNFNSVEIIKGPGSSLYGAGTGGVLMIQGLSETEQPGAFAEYATGSFGMQNIYGSITTGNKKFISKAGIQHQESKGFRDHSQLRRDMISWSGLFLFDSTRQLKTTFLYGDLFYETPGALTKQEYQSNPKMARPGSGGFPGAAQAGASVRQRTFLAGASYTQHIFPWLQTKSSVYGAFTQLHNPTIQNYGRSNEPHVGGRFTARISKNLGRGLLAIDIGSEWQQGFTTYSIHDNRNGKPDTLRTSNEVNNRQSILFAQASVDIRQWIFTAGLSANQRKVNFNVFSPNPVPEQSKNFNQTLTPRFAIMRKLGQTTLYSSISKGFSPPTTEEVFPTGGSINLDLEAENGVSYDAGIRTSIGPLYIDINAFTFSLNNTIVLRRTASGGNYYINAGKTKQRGLETYLSIPILKQIHFMEQNLLWLSHTWHHFKYKEFQQTIFDMSTFTFKTENYSGNKLPGIPDHTISTGYDFVLKNGFLGSFTYFFNSKLPLNDSNNDFTQSFHLIGAKLGYQLWLKEKYRLKIVAGAENLLDEIYSLGNDINGFGGRYYNAAAGRNFYTSFIFQWVRQ